MGRGEKKTIGSATAPKGRGKSLPEVQKVSIDAQRFQWSAQAIDHAYSGEWDWDLRPDEAKNILDLLARTSQLTWREVKDLKFNSKTRSRPLHHHQPRESICPDAQRRLSELDIDAEEVFRLRHGNLERLWGYVTGPVFHIVWWDRKHRVCPQEN
jgi:hypothetical protein